MNMNEIVVVFYSFMLGSCRKENKIPFGITSILLDNTSPIATGVESFRKSRGEEEPIYWRGASARLALL